MRVARVLMLVTLAAMVFVIAGSRRQSRRTTPQRAADSARSAGSEPDRAADLSPSCAGSVTATRTT